MATAGRAVVFSGGDRRDRARPAALMPVPFIRSMGIGGLLIPLVSVAAALTLQPALLSLLGPTRCGPPARRARPRRARRRVLGRARAGDHATARPLPGRRDGACSSRLRCRPSTSTLTPGSISSLPQSPESVRGYVLLRDRRRRRARHARPTSSVDAGGAGLARAPTGAACDRPARRPARPRPRDADRRERDEGRRTWTRRGRYAQVIVAGRHEYGDDGDPRLRPPAARPARSRRRGFPPGCTRLRGRRARRRASTSSPARTTRSRGSCSACSRSPTSSSCARSGRSLLPLKAVLLNLLTVAAVYGLLVVVFRWGVGAGLLGVGRADHDRGVDPDLPLRRPVRALDGLRGVHGHADARGVGRDGRQRAARSRAGSSAPAGSSRPPR